jgi:hypothetical protein
MGGRASANKPFSRRCDNEVHETCVELAMAKYLISFPSAAMRIDAEDMDAVVADSHAVIREAKWAGVYVFAGGLDDAVAPVTIHPDGHHSPDTHPHSRHLNGGFCILELPTRDAALEWAAKLAKACRCPQELRVFMYDEES